MEKLICECCGGAINPISMQCEYCGTFYQGTKDGVKYPNIAKEKRATYLTQLLDAGIPVDVALQMIEKDKIYLKKEVLNDL